MQRGKVKIQYKDKMVDATLVDVIQASELWNQYLLDDQTVLKFKTVVSQVVKIDNEYDSDGNPVYVVKSSSIVTVICPEELKKKDV